MKEREARGASWNVEPIARFLDAAPEGASDIAFGEGVRFVLGAATDPTSIELFADVSTVRITTPDAQVTLRRVEPPELRGEQLVLEQKPNDQPGVRAAVNAAGEVTLSHSLDEGSVEAAAGEITNSGGTAERGGREAVLEQAVKGLVDALERCGGDEPSCPNCGPAREFAAEILASETKSTSPTESEQERLTIAGRVGAVPSFRTTSNGVVLARFPIAILGDDDKTTWETVVAFGKRAEALRGAIQKGQRIEVVGYAHEREFQARGGSLKKVREIYAAAITPR
ncbi:MAG: single-stranded DNA-binding protein [Dehalococcoidia bacterium]|nr:single-stranded DNA-binding protein [Dehalococcoidia bacterium]